MTIHRRVLDWFMREDRLIAAAILRVGFGVLLLALYLLHYEQRYYLWGPEGLLPHAEFARELRGAASYSLYVWADTPWRFELVFHTGLLVTVLWTLGVLTRPMGVVTYAFAFSLWQRNGYILDGGDNILILCLLFLLAARSDRHLTLGPWLRALVRRRVARRTGSPVPAGPEPRTRGVLYTLGTILHNGAMAGIIAQVSVLYLTSALNKVQGQMWQDGVALYYVMRVQEFTWPGVSELVYRNGLVIVLLTYATVFEQLSYPFMLLHRVAKRISVFIVVQMHLGIAVFMGLVSFSAVMITLQAPAFTDAEFRAALSHIRAAGAMLMRVRHTRLLRHLRRPGIVAPEGAVATQATR